MGFFSKLKAKKQNKTAEKQIKFDYDFKLTLNFTTGEEEFPDPSVRVVENAVAALAESSENFLILESKDGVDGFNFIQATDGDGGEKSVWVEAQRVEKEGNFLVNYGKKLNLKTACDILSAFIEKSVPDISDWEKVGEYPV